MSEAKTAMHDMADMIISHASDQLGLDERVTMLNADQKHIFASVNTCRDSVIYGELTINE